MGSCASASRARRGAVALGSPIFVSFVGASSDVRGWLLFLGLAVFGFGWGPAIRPSALVGHDADGE